jgi:hypothetical protein
MTTAQESQENRLLAFANVFKGYMGVMPIVTAALAPVLTAMNVIPTYETQRKPLAVMAGILGFLLLAWLFYVRRTIALGSITRGFRVLFNLQPLPLSPCSRQHHLLRRLCQYARRIASRSLKSASQCHAPASSR